MALDTAPLGNEASSFTLPANVEMETAQKRNMSSRTIFPSLSRQQPPRHRQGSNNRSDTHNSGKQHPLTLPVSGTVLSDVARGDTRGHENSYPDRKSVV